MDFHCHHHQRCPHTSLQSYRLKSQMMNYVVSRMLLDLLLMVADFFCFFFASFVEIMLSASLSLSLGSPAKILFALSLAAAIFAASFFFFCAVLVVVVTFFVAYTFAFLGLGASEASKPCSELIERLPLVVVTTVQSSSPFTSSIVTS